MKVYDSCTPVTKQAESIVEEPTIAKQVEETTEELTEQPVRRTRRVRE